MATAENAYTAEVASAKQRIKILKNRLARRAAARQGVASGKQAGTPAGQVPGEGDEAATVAAEATATLKGLIAAHLLQLEPHQLPSDSQNIQKKVDAKCGFVMWPSALPSLDCAYTCSWAKLKKQLN